MVIGLRVSQRVIVPLLSLRLANPEQCLIHLFNYFRAFQDADVIIIETTYGNRLPLCFEAQLTFKRDDPVATITAYP